MENKQIRNFVKSQIRKNKKKRKPYDKKTPEELLKILKRVGGDTHISEYKYKELKNVDDPSPLTYYRRFGSWKNACEMIWGKKKIDPKVIFNQKIDEKYLVKLILELDIKNQAEYIKRRKSNPDIVPSYRFVTKLFKNFINLKKATEKFSINEQLMRCLYVRLSMKKCPSLYDYRQAGINVDLLLKKYHLQSEINRLVRLLEVAYEKKRGNKVENVESDGKMLEREKEKIFIPFNEQLRK